VLITYSGWIQEVAAEMASGVMMYIPSFMTISSGTQVIRYYLNNLSGAMLVLL
jgi:hypothetical protein